MLSIKNLSKTYPNGVKALDNVSLTINKGMFGLLGPNGAGKSSLMRTIATLQEPDSGSITFDTLDVLTQKAEVRKILGYLPQEFGVYPRVSAELLLDHLAVLKGITDSKARNEVVTHLLHRTNLWEHRKKNLSGYSGGMKQRFGIAQALLANPTLIIVDEPTAGLDPAERNRFHNLLAEIGETAVVILSTHIVDDVKELCTDMAIINRGKILMQGNPLEALATMEGKVWSRRVDKTEVAGIKAALPVISDKMIAGKPELRIFADAQPDASWEAAAANLEDVYFAHIAQQTA